MLATEKLDLELARQHHEDLVRKAARGPALAASGLNTEYAAGIGATVPIGIIADGLRGWLRRLTTPRRRPAGAH